MTNVPSDAVPIAIPTEVVDLPVHEMRRGYRSDVYFWRAKRTLEKHKMREIATIQVFQKKKAILCGIEEVLALLALGTGHYRNPQKAFDLIASQMRSKKRVRSL